MEPGLFQHHLYEPGVDLKHDNYTYLQLEKYVFLLDQLVYTTLIFLYNTDTATLGSVSHQGYQYKSSKI